MSTMTLRTLRKGTTSSLVSQMKRQQDILDRDSYSNLSLSKYLNGFIENLSASQAFLEQLVNEPVLNGNSYSK